MGIQAHAHVYIIYNTLYLFIYIEFSLQHRVLPGPGVSFTLRKHAKTDHKNGYVSDLEDRVWDIKG